MTNLGLSRALKEVPHLNYTTLLHSRGLRAGEYWGTGKRRGRSQHVCRDNIPG